MCMLSYVYKLTLNSREFKMNNTDLVQKSIEAKASAYAPYSKFPVGVALLTTKGVFLGANIENSSYSMTCCAERTALCLAHMQGCRKGDYLSIAINGDTKQPLPPCGACRQIMSEFFLPDTEVILSNKDGDFTVYKFSEIMPLTFTGLDH